MINVLKKILGIKTIDFKKLVHNGALIIDVRTVAEYNNAHLRNAKNIPLQDLKAAMETLIKTQPIITCCASGVRSESAKAILKNNGFEAYNGGSWKNLEKKLKS